MRNRTNGQRGGLRRLAIAAGALGMALAVAACEPRIDNRGNFVDDEDLALIKPGQTSRTEVQAILGSPSSIATFDENVWLYVGGRSERRAFFKPAYVSRQVVAVAFDEAGRVREVERLDLDDSKTIALVARETPTAGQSITLLQQIVGNIGRFNPDQTGGGVRGAPGGVPGR